MAMLYTNREHAEQECTKINADFRIIEKVNQEFSTQRVK